MVTAVVTAAATGTAAVAAAVTAGVVAAVTATGVAIEAVGAVHERRNAPSERRPSRCPTPRSRQWEAPWAISVLSASL